MEERKPGYYAIIPADVRYDDRIPANAKLLYGEISALIGADGFCFASNQYFADVYGCTPVTVARLISKLEENGYIKRELVRDNTGQIVQRKLYLSVSMPEIQPLNNFDNTPQQNCGEGINKNVKDTNTSITNNIPPIIPQEGEGEGDKSNDGLVPRHKPERFMKLWAIWPKNRRKARRDAVKAWDKLQASDALLDEMSAALARQMQGADWKRGIGVPYPSTWLNGRRWEDEPEEPEETAGGGRQWADDPEVMGCGS